MIYQISSGQGPAECELGVAKFLNYRTDSEHGDLLQSVHGAFPGELSPRSFGVNEKKHRTFLCDAFLSGGDYRDRTGDLLHAMQALSRTTHSRTPTQRCEDERYSSL